MPLNTLFTPLLALCSNSSLPRKACQCMEYWLSHLRRIGQALSRRLQSSYEIPPCFLLLEYMLKQVGPKLYTGRMGGLLSWAMGSNSALSKKSCFGALRLFCSYVWNCVLFSIEFFPSIVSTIVSTLLLLRIPEGKGKKYDLGIENPPQTLTLQRT